MSVAFGCNCFSEREKSLDPFRIGGGVGVACVVIQSVSICFDLQIAVQNPLVSERMELAVLYKEYADDDHVYQQKIKVRVTWSRLEGGSGFKLARASSVGIKHQLGCFVLIRGEGARSGTSNRRNF